MIPSKRDDSISDQFQLRDLRANYGAQLKASWDSAVNDSFGMSLVRSIVDSDMNRSDPTARLSANEARSRIQTSGIYASTWDLARIEDNQYTEASIDRYIREQRERIALYGMIGDNNGMLRGGSLFLAGIAASLTDPVEFSSNLIPFSRASSIGRSANLAARNAPSLLRRTGARFVAGSIDGGVGSAALEPFYAAMRNQNPLEEYGIADSFLNVTMGTLAGGGIHGTIGAAGDGVRGYLRGQHNRRMAPFRQDAELIRTHEGLSQALTQDNARSVALSREVAQAMPAVRSIPSARQPDVIRNMGDAVTLSERIKAARESDPNTPIAIPEGTPQQVVQMAQFLADNEGALPRLMENYANEVRNADARANADSAKSSDSMIDENGIGEARTDVNSDAATPTKAPELDQIQIANKAIERTMAAPERAADQFSNASPDAKWDSLRAAMLEWGQDKNLQVAPIIEADKTPGSENALIEAGRRMSENESLIGYDKDGIINKPVNPDPIPKTELLEAETRQYEYAKTTYSEIERSYAEEIKYARGEPPVREATAAQVAQIKNDVKKSFSNSTAELMDSGRLEVVDTVDSLPYGPHPLDTKAMTLPDGRVFIVAQNVTPDEIKGIVLHEVGVHVGMHRMVGTDVFISIKESIDDAIARGESWAQEARANLPEDTPAKYRQEELLAYVVENNPDLTITQRIISAIKTWVYRNFEAGQALINLNDRDLAYLAVASLRSVALDADGLARSGVFYSREIGEDTRPFAEQIQQGEQDIVTARSIGDKLVEIARIYDDPEAMQKALRESFADLDATQLKAVSDELDRRINEALQGRADFAQTQADDITKALQNVADDFAADLQRAALQDQRVRYINETKRLENMKFIREFVKPLYESKPGFWARRKQAGLDREAFAALIFGSNLKRFGGKNSIDAVYRGTRDKSMQSLYSDMERRGCWETFINKENEQDIFNAVVAIGKKQDISKFAPEIVNVAESLININEHLRSQLNEHGAWIGKLDDYVIPQTHDSTKLIGRGFDAWKEFVLPRLDIQRTFGNIGQDRINSVLRDVYEGISSGVHEKASPDKIASTAFGAGSSIARKASEERVLHFRDGTAQFEYSKEFGHGDLVFSTAMAIDRNARNIALMNRLGTNPQNMLSRLMDEHMSNIRGDARRARAFSGSRKKIQDMFKHVDGSINIAVGENLAKWIGCVRAWQSMSKLGGAVFSSIADIPVMASELRALDGGNLLGKSWDSMRGMLERLSPEEQKLLLETMQYMDASIMGSISSRFDAPDLVPGALNKGMFYFFKFNGLTGWTENMRRAFVMEYGSILARRAQQAFADLPETTRGILEWYGIDSARWNVARQAVLPSADGRRFFGPDAVKSIPDSAFAKYLTDTGRTVSPESIERARVDLERDLRTMMVDRMNTAVIEPGAKTRYTMYGGTQPGTAEGELLRMAMQFKSFPTALLQLVYGRDIHGKGFDTLGDFATHGKGAMVQLASFIALSTAFGYIAMSAKDVVKGKEPRPTDKPATWAAAFTQGGGLGLYGDFLFGEFNRFGGGFTSALAGPTLGMADQAMNIFARVRDGDDAAASAFNAALQNTPFLNLFYVRPAMNYMILNRINEALNPGYHSRMRRRVRQQNGQEFYEWAHKMFGG